MTQVAMSPGQAALVLFGAFFVLIALRVPVAFALGLACLPPLLFEQRLSPLVLFNETSSPTTLSSCWRCRSSS